jgi:large subunit ribosomal protein L25
MTKLKAQSRKILGKKNKLQRKNKILPGVVYGHGFKSQPIELDLINFEKIFKEVGMTSLIDLEIEDQKPIKVLIHDLQHDFLTNKIQHVDFYKIKTGEKITVEVKLNFINEAPMVKEQGGVLYHNLEELEIKCLPENLINEIKVDLSKLKTFEDMIRVKDLEIPEGIELITDKEELVVQVERPKTTAQLEAELEEEEKEEVVVEEEEKEEEEDEEKKESLDKEKQENETIKK